MEALEKKHLIELALRAAHTGRTQFTRFLEPSAEADVRTAANQSGSRVCFFGGYEGAERRMAAFFDDEPPADDDFPIAALELNWNAKFCSVGHRDLLGAVMGLGLERETTGDICMSTDEGSAYLFACEDMSDYIAATLESAGRAKLSIRRTTTLNIRPPEGSTLRVTVQQLRMDAVLAAGCKLSRSEAQRLISAGLVKRNHVVEERTDVRLESGDLLSVRGYGRMRIEEIQGETRKGRIGVVLFRYGT